MNSNSEGVSVISPEWPAPLNIRALTTTRKGGVSLPPYDSFNLADHVGDNPLHVRENRRRLRQELQLSDEPRWLRQVHGTAVPVADEIIPGCCEGDASVTQQPGVVCAVLTADCLPLLLCDLKGTRVAAVHAGWRGLLNGVIESAIAAMGCTGAELLAWLGPAIGPDAFEVGDEVREAFIAGEAAAAGAFRPSPNGRWLADIYQLAKLRLASKGVTAVFGGGLCTLSEPERFYSYRRDGVTGRMATLIWMECE